MPLVTYYLMSRYFVVVLNLTSLNRHHFKFVTATGFAILLVVIVEVSHNWRTLC